jgi:glycosyltransferase involved in cell wall biosynthesis
MRKVAVIVTVYNGEATVARALDSILAQDFPDFSLWVVDDGSTDGTAKLLERYAGQARIIHAPRSGIGGARNRALEAVDGEFVAFLDADDVWLPHKLSRSMAVFERDPGCVLVYSNATLVYPAGIEVGQFVEPATAHAPTLDEMLTQHWPILESMVVMRRDTLEAAGGFVSQPDVPRVCGGYYVFLRAREMGHFVYLPERLVIRGTAPYPDFLDRDGEMQRRLAYRPIIKRYGARGRRFVRNVNRHRGRQHVHFLGYQGLVAMREGRRAEARRYFIRALGYERTSLKNAFRLVRTFLPARLVRALTGRTRAA